MTDERRARRPAPRVLVALSVVTGLVFAWPFLYIVWRNLTLGSDFWGELTSASTLEALGRTVALATTVALTAAALGTALAWLVVRTDVPFRRLWRVLAPLPLVFPSFVGAAALIAALGRGGLVEKLVGEGAAAWLPPVHGFAGAWLVLTLFTYPYVLLPVAARLAQLPPSLEESGRLLGRGRWAVVRTIVLPQCRGAIWAGGLLVFLYTVSDFGAVKLLRYDTLTTQIFANRLFDRAQSFALALVLALVALVVVGAERANGRRAVQTEAMGAGRALVTPLGRWRVPALAAVVVVLGNALLGPVVTLGYWAVRGLTGTGSGSADLADAAAPTLSSAGIGVLTAAVAVTVVLPLAYVTTRYRSRVGGAANTFVVSGFAIPGLVVALALVFWVLNTPVLSSFYQTLPVLIFAYVVHFGAQSMRAAQVAVGGVSRGVGDAATMLGAGPVRRFRTIDLPLMAPGLLAGAGLVLLSTMKELPATLLLRPTRVETLSTRIWNAAEDGFLTEMSIAALILVALSGVLTWLLVIRPQPFR